MDVHQEWPAEWLRGVLELCVLRAVADGPTYGYQISARLEQGGLGKVRGGTLYPLLKRFETKRWVDVEWRPGEGGPGRKYYVLTAEGGQRLQQMSAQWVEFTVTTTALLQEAGAAGPGAENVEESET